MSTTDGAPRVLLLGGLDPSGGAGLTLDAQVVALHGGHPLPVPLVLTAQNRHGFRAAFPVPASQWRRALAAACDDGTVCAVKTGLLGSADAVLELAAALRPFAGRVPLVVDPVLSATAGGLEAGEALVAAYRDHLLPLATLLTPNLPEFAALFGGDLELAARAVPALLLKGGHAEGEFAEDRLVQRTGERCYRRPRLPVGPVRGTGCALAAAIATKLASGLDLAAACEAAGDWLACALAGLGPARPDGLPRLLLTAGTAAR